MLLLKALMVLNENFTAVYICSQLDDLVVYHPCVGPVTPHVQRKQKLFSVFFRHKGSQRKPSTFPLNLCVNCSDVSFCVSSRNHFTAVEFLMEIKSIQQESSCLPLSGCLSFTLHFEVKRRKARNITLRKNKLSLFNVS